MHMIFFDRRARVGPGPAPDWTFWPGPGPFQSGPDLKGQGQQKWLRAGLDRPVDSLHGLHLEFMELCGICGVHLESMGECKVHRTSAMYVLVFAVFCSKRSANAIIWSAIKSSFCCKRAVASILCSAEDLL